MKFGNYLKEQEEQLNNQKNIDDTVNNEIKKQNISEEQLVKVVTRNNSDFEIKDISISQLIPYENQPFKKYDEEKEKEMIESIKINGILQEPIVRKFKDEMYEILSGHNRINCAKKIGLDTVKCKVVKVTDEQAKLIMVETNLISREKISTIEMAKALKIKYEALRNSPATDNIRNYLNKFSNMSQGNVQRYLRINHLNSTLQAMVEDKKISLKVAENLSFLQEEEQKALCDFLKENDINSISEKQAKTLKEGSANNFDVNLMENLFKSNSNIKEKICIIFSIKEVQKYFGNTYDEKIIKKKIIKELNKNLAYK